MISVQRILPYTKQLVLYALYDVLDSEESEYDKAENGRIAAKVTVYGNQSGFTLSVSEQPPATVLTVEISAPYGGLSRQGQLLPRDGSPGGEAGGPHPPDSGPHGRLALLGPG